MKIIAYPGDNSACGYYRIHTPIRIANQNGYKIDRSETVEFEHLLNTKKSNKEIEKIQKKILKKPALETKYNFSPKYDLYVFQRQHDKANLNRILYLMSRGAKTVYEMDDNLFAIDKTNPAYGHFNEPEAQKTIIESCRIASALTVSTAYLAKIVNQLNEKVYVLPNSLDLKLWETYRVTRKAYQENRDNKIRIGYAGSPTHFIDFRIVKNVIPAILRKNPNVIFKFIGFDWRQVFKSEFEGLDNQIEISAPASLEEWPHNLANLDIGIAPLADTEFNRCKSNLKWLEYSALEIPTIASAVEPYRTISNDRTGIIIGGDSEKLWIRELTGLIKSRVKQEELGKAARLVIEKKYDANVNWQYWVKCYEEVLNVDKIKKAS